MRKKFLKSVLITSLSAALIFGCPILSSTTFASTEEVVEEGSTISISIEEETDESEIQTLVNENEIAVYASKDVAINATNFPDPNFRQYVSDNIDTDGNGTLNATEISKCTEIRCGYSDISTLTGIEFFSNLETLYCYGNKLTNLDVSKNVKLKTLDCGSNNLSSLNVSNNIALEKLYCASTNLNSLNVTKNVNLITLDCGWNNLSSLNVSKNTALESLYCHLNNLSNLDISKNTKLTSLACFDNNLTSLDISKNMKLIDLNCGNNKLQSLDVSKHTALERLECYGNNLNTLDVSKNTQLINLTCGSNNLSNLDVSKNTKLIALGCESNNLTSLDVKKNTELQVLMCYDNKLNNLNVYNMSVEVYCWGNKFTSLENAEHAKIILLNTPVVNTPTKVSSGVKVSWSKSIGADGYYVYRRVKGGSWKKIATVGNEISDQISYIDKSASAGATYEYTVKGFYHFGVPPYEPGDQGYVSGYDKKGKSITLNLATPKISTVNNVNGGVKITWGKVDGAAKYRVYYKTASGKWTKIADTTSTSYTWKKAKSGTKYRFTVRCISSDGKSFTSSYDSTGKGKTYIAAPKLSSVSNTASGVKISWGKVTGAAKYRVYYKTGSGSWKKIADTTSTSYTWKGAKKGTTYTFTVRCISSDAKSFTSGYDSTGKKITYTGK